MTPASFGRRFRRLFATVAIIAAGLALRGFGYEAGLPFLVVKYGGSLLWGAMVFFLVAAVIPVRRVMTMALVALLMATAVEMSRLFHAPALDTFRLTTAGALLLGRVFSLWNILAYAIGIIAAAALDAGIVNRQRGSAA